jgi:SAM-dependent methyltransferase
MKKEKWTEASHRILEQADGLEHYNRWLVNNFEPYFGKTILEVGSGLGALSKLLPSKSIIILSDVYPAYITHLKTVFTDPVLDLDVSKSVPADLVGKLDTIFSSNVFEHIEDDDKALKNCFRLLETGGRLLLFVPARPEIYGKLDSDMGHYRRYVKSELISKTEDAGFHVLDCHYANLLGYFLWWGRGRLSSTKSDSRFANFYDKFIVPLMYLEKYVLPPFGQSLVLIAEKP